MSVGRHVPARSPVSDCQPGWGVGCSEVTNPAEQHLASLQQFDSSLTRAMCGCSVLLNFGKSLWMRLNAVRPVDVISQTVNEQVSDLANQKSISISAASTKHCEFSQCSTHSHFVHIYGKLGYTLGDRFYSKWCEDHSRLQRNNC